jgi:hypothetical protein
MTKIYVSFKGVKAGRRLGERILATFSATCPICGRYIAKNRSWIAHLPEPMTHPDWWVPEDKFEGWGGYWQHPPQQWAHEKIAEKLRARHRREGLAR